MSSMGHWHFAINWLKHEGIHIFVTFLLRWIVCICNIGYLCQGSVLFIGLMKSIPTFYIGMLRYSIFHNNDRFNCSTWHKTFFSPFRHKNYLAANFAWECFVKFSIHTFNIFKVNFDTKMWVRPRLNIRCVHTLNYALQPMLEVCFVFIDDKLYTSPVLEFFSPESIYDVTTIIGPYNIEYFRCGARISIFSVVFNRLLGCKSIYPWIQSEFSIVGQCQPWSIGHLSVYVPHLSKHVVTTKTLVTRLFCF